MSEGLIDRSRLRGVSRTIAQGADAQAVTPDQIRQVAADVELFSRSSGTTRKAIAEAVGYSPGTVSDFLNGKYAGNEGQLAIDLEEWLVEEEQRRTHQQETEFVWTNFAMTIKATADYCLDFKKVGLVYGPESSGFGKSTALKAIHQELGPRRSALVSYDKADANPSGMMRKILQGMHLDDSGSSAKRMDRIVKHLTGRSHILLMDQIHNLRYAKLDRPFYYLMDIFEATKTAQLWAGTSDMVAYLTRQQTRMMDEPLAQIRRRIFPCVDLMESVADGGGGAGGEPLYTVEQVRQMFSRFRLKLSGSAARWLCALARVPGGGGLGVCVQIMEYAVMLGLAHKAACIEIPLLKEALRNGLTCERANQTIREAECVMDRSLKVA